MFNKKLVSQLAAAALLVVSSVATHATVVFNNFVEPGNGYSDSGRVIQGPDIPGSTSKETKIDQAVAFTVGANNYKLTSILLGLWVNDSPWNGSGPINVEIAADSGGLPGAVLLTIPTYVSFPPNHKILTANSPGTFELQANTTYWVIADALGTFHGGWDYPDVNNPDVGPTAGRSNDGSWSLHSASDGRMALQVNGRLAAVPEPSTYFAGASALGMVLLGLRRRQ